MAQALINAVVSKSLFETQLETIESLRIFLGTKEDTDMEFMNELLNEFKSKVEAEYKPPKGAAKALKEVPQAKKTKKAKVGETKKSAYTLYIQYRMTSDDFKALHPDCKGKTMMSKAIASWTALPDSFKEQMKKLTAEEPELTGEQLFTRVSTMEPEATTTATNSAPPSTPSAPKKASAKPTTTSCDSPSPTKSDV